MVSFKVKDDLDGARGLVNRLQLVIGLALIPSLVSCAESVDLSSRWSRSEQFHALALTRTYQR
jgi:hypothetical protein